jgi:hypothetical protein
MFVSTILDHKFCGKINFPNKEYNMTLKGLLGTNTVSYYIATTRINTCVIVLTPGS